MRDNKTFYNGREHLRNFESVFILISFVMSIDEHNIINRDEDAIKLRRDHTCEAGSIDPSILSNTCLYLNLDEDI